MKLILSSFGALAVGLICLALAVVVCPEPAFVPLAAFFVGVTVTLALFMRPQMTLVRAAPPAAPSFDEPSESDDEVESDDEDEQHEVRRAHVNRVRDALAREPRKSSSLWIVFVGLWFVVDALKSSKDLSYVAVLIGVLLVHEAGHFLGMKLFGYRDVKVFFIPGFGAATSGKPEGAARWKQGVVLLLGPMPGLIVGAVLLTQRPLPPLTAQIAVLLVIINGLNLLPLGALDGGKLVHLALFSRRRVLEAPFLFCANIGLIGLALFLQSWVLGALAIFGLVTVRANAKLGQLADEVRERHATLQPLERLSDRELGDVLDTVRSSLPAAPPPSIDDLAAMIRNVHEAARAEPVTPRQSMFLLSGYATGLAIALGGGLILFAR